MKKTILKSYLLILFLVTTAFKDIGTHKNYFSLTEINLNVKTNKLEIISNLFIDDFERSIQNNYGIDLKNKNLKNIDYEKQIKYYIGKKLQLKINSEKITLKLIGYENEGNIIFIYLESEKIEKIEKIEILNNILTEEFKEQQNIVKIDINKKRKSIFLDKENNNKVLNFQ